MRKRNNPIDRFARDLPAGTLEWIGVRPARRSPMRELACVNALAGLGLAGDHRSEKTPGSGRQVTLISREFIAQIAHFTGAKHIDPAILRRNLVVSGVNLNALRYQRFRIGEALFEAGALCHPCSRMEQALGKGGVAAMLGHGGLCCRILESGKVGVGDRLLVEGQNMELFDN
ncbi:MOSC domain-containing protein [Pseudohalioglobus lutimaris]|uniref:MOSC domain-containing protein n=1 Tax=Pseudohalioglobus lutimaris TaxID=1737061 RepID=A0A2N5X121_9GAMM|nr:MOSC domain-containing protein [Pseudohalioglobus lutimaris]PLW68176.1 MOSC domain-containing protein [Pseudohalioglobus lutimaris]